MSDETAEGTKAAVSTLPCGQCGAELEFKPGTTRLKCGYCGHEQTIEVREGAQVVEYDLNDAIQRYLGRVHHAKPGTRLEVKCQDCGADILVESGTKTARCDYCGGRRLVEEELPPDVLLPDALLPFAFDLRNAEERFRRWLAGEGFWKRLWVRLVRPSELQSRNSVFELHGNYVPFWTYDTHAHSNWTAQSGYYYYVTQTYRDGQGRMQTRQVRKIRWVWTSGARRDFFDDWLICAARPFQAGPLQGLMHAIEPFPTKAVVPYDPKYLAGFHAERYSVELRAGWEIALKGIRSELQSRCGRDVPGDTHRFLEVRSTFWGQSFKHVLLPVYLLSYRFREKLYHVLINGSTGEVRGHAPLSWIKVTLLIIAGLALTAAIVALIALLNAH